MNETITQHKSDCKMAFGRKDVTCTRCQELLNGSEPRKAWGWQNKLNQQRTINSIRNHDCKASNCHPTVCTAFDW